MSRGVAPGLLLEQVRNTAAWALDAADDGDGPTEWCSALLDAPTRAEPWDPASHLRVMLAAHYATVGTFVPTDVDARIRHHAWQEMDDGATLEAAVDVVDHAASWDPRLVSARVTETSGGPLSGHDGEWLSVRAGALGRALQLVEAGVACDDLADRVEAAIEAELAREAEAMRDAIARAEAVNALRVATTLAHNLGDLSRVVDQWPSKSPRAAALRTRWTRLGHDDAQRYGGLFALAGRVNKGVMSVENHRFLSLRKPRGLRRSHALLLPIGPFFDDWGRTVATHEALDTDDRAQVLDALLDTHESAPGQLGVLRAIVGMHQAHPGGVEAIAARLPARARKRIGGGEVRAALGVDRARFEARMANRWRAVLTGRG